MIGWQIQPFQIPSHLIHLWVTGYLADFLWCCSLCSVTLILTERKYLTKWNNMIILSVPFASEIAQKYHLIPGTFDWIDFGLYAVVEFIFITLIFKIDCHENP